jgi:hypothetical protein
MSMRNVYYLTVLLGLVPSAWAQLDSESIPPAQDVRELYARAATSQLAVIATVIKSEGVTERVPVKELQERLNQGTIRRGSLKTIKVEEIVCRQSDFDAKAPKVDDRPQPFYLFIPRDDSDLPHGDFREELLPEQRYLILLSQLDTNSLTAIYELDPNRIYYRGTGHNRGVIPLEPVTPTGRTKNPPEVVDKFRRLCAAMRPSKAEDKLALLQQLSDSGDPVLQKEAEIAKNAIKAHITQDGPKAK